MNKVKIPLIRLHYSKQDKKFILLGIKRDYAYSKLS